MMKYFVLLSLLIVLVSCNDRNKPASEKKENKKVETSKQVPVKTNNQVAQIGIDENLIRLATQNRDSVRLSQKARLDTLMKDSGKRYAIQDAMGKFKKGMEFYENKDFPAALEQFKLALANIPENNKVNYYLGLLYFEKAEYDLSLSYYSDAVRFDPLDSLALLGAGQVFFTKGDYPAAMELYDLSIQVGQNYGTAYYNRGTLLGMNKNYTGALADLNKAIELDPSNGNAFVNRGNAYFMLKQANSACRDWKIAADMGEPNGISSYEKHCK